jgi:heme a synthase
MNPALHRFAQLTACATFVLIVAGGLVTSTGSSLAVPDWPLSYGQFFPPMVGGIFYEHGHRMIAGTTAILTAILAAWLWLREPRRWLARLGLVCVGVVLFQAVLGGITVLFLLPPAVSVSHAATAMVFFCLTSSVALFTSRDWTQGVPRRDADQPSPPFGLAATALVAIYLQILLGALMRHTGSGLAIPTFPLAFGRLVPPLEDFGVQINFAHRVGAVVVTVLVSAVVARIVRSERGEPRLIRPALLLLGLLVAQITLGAFTIWTAKAVEPTTAHVATGALMLVVTLRIALQARRLQSLPAARHSVSPVAAVSGARA